MKPTVTVNRAELVAAVEKLESGILSLVGLDAALPQGRDDLIDELRDVLHELHSARGTIRNELLDAELQGGETPVQ